MEKKRQPPAIKVENLGINDLHGCDFCKGAIHPVFYVIDIRAAAIDPRTANQFLGMHQYFEGKSPVLAELFTPGCDAMASICDEPDARTRLFICMKCYPEKVPLLDEVAKSRTDEINAERRAELPLIRDALQSEIDDEAEG